MDHWWIFTFILKEQSEEIMQFREYALREKRFSEDQKSAEKILKLLRSPLADKYQISDYIYDIPRDEMEQLGITDKDVENLERTSGGNEDFSVFSFRKVISIHLNVDPKKLLNKSGV
jgi:hypothetical protein